MKRSVSVFLVVLILICASLPAFGQEQVKPDLTYKGIRLRSSGVDVFEDLVNKKIVPFDKMNTIEIQNDKYGYLDEFDDTIAGHNVKTRMQIRWNDIHKKEWKTSKLVYVFTYYSGRMFDWNNAQTVYSDIVNYFSEQYGEDYTEKENAVIWDKFRNENAMRFSPMSR